MNKKDSKTYDFKKLMKRAWKLFRDGLISFSLSLKVSWQIAKNLLTESQVYKSMKGGRK